MTSDTPSSEENKKQRRDMLPSRLGECGNANKITEDNRTWVSAGAKGHVLADDHRVRMLGRLSCCAAQRTLTNGAVKNRKIMLEQNYWLTTAQMPAVEATGPLPEMVDVAVIGAGFTGLSAARTLSKKGAKVAALESETIGWGASSRNGGMVLTGMKLGVGKLKSMYGQELSKRMYAASLASIDCVEQIVREEAIDCSFSRCG